MRTNQFEAISHLTACDRPTAINGTCDFVIIDERFRDHLGYNGKTNAIEMIITVNTHTKSRPLINDNNDDKYSNVKTALE